MQWKWRTDPSVDVGKYIHSFFWNIMDAMDMELYDDYEAPFDCNTGVDRKYLYLSLDAPCSPPGSPVLKNSGNFFFKHCS